MKTKMKFLMIAVISMIIFSCSKDKNTANVTVKMKDSPVLFDEVWVDIVSVDVQVGTAGSNSGWVSLETKSGSYNLLLLQDGVTATLSTDNQIPVGKLNQMRLILGNDNYVVIDGVTYPLATNSQTKTGLKLNLNVTVSPDDNIEVLFDFDAEKSIVVEEDNVFRLKPVLSVETIIVN